MFWHLSTENKYSRKLFPYQQKTNIPENCFHKWLLSIVASFAQNFGTIMLKVCSSYGYPGIQVIAVLILHNPQQLLNLSMHATNYCKFPNWMWYINFLFGNKTTVYVLISLNITIETLLGDTRSDYIPYTVETWL